MTKFKKFHQFLFCLLILFLPTQLGKHFWPSWSVVLGIRIDYLAPIIYLTDLLVLGILVSWTLSLRLKTKNEKVSQKRNSLREAKTKNTNKKLKYFTFLSLFFIANIIFSQNKPVALLKFLKITELFLLGVYVKNNLTIRQFNNLTILLSGTVIYSSLIAWAQFLKQGSIGGILWWLGERTFTPSSLGIAQVTLNGGLFLRPYATFPHPNVLGGYLAVVLPLLVQGSRTSTSSVESFKVQGEKLKLREIVNLVAVFLGIVTLFITFSRAAWIIGGLGIITSFFWPSLEVKRGSRRLRVGNCLLLAISCLLFALLFCLGKERFLSLRTDTESLMLRQELNQTALLMIKKQPLVGVGLNNFIPSLPRFKKGLEFKKLQPTHNIYLLIGAETGLVGLGIFLWLIWIGYRRLFYGSIVKLLKKRTKAKTTIWQYSNIAIVLTLVLLLGLFDHYFFTLQQTQLLLAIVFGAIFGLRLKHASD